ncbi:hypothetical protein HPB48_001658 [Haemaphysalis longicornis]|uniref:DDE-1 domain-containing protein n=1 Tax=Haemaphysalis longicornis TaxID=44386 RepID=A0A9J6F6T1_HAELO|nr:hypothetical protein HPB48_001658 [Haemaphysalis longicornis]
MWAGQAWDVELGKSGSRACLLVDNCSAHHTTCELKNIGLKFLPANTTAKLQPLDQDIIKSFKVGYRRRLLDRLLVNLRMGTELKVDLLDVKTDTVANCFRKAGFWTAELAETGEDGDEERIDDAFRELSTLFPAAVPPEVSADDFVEVDCNVQAVASLADEDIVAAVAGTQDAQAASSSGDEDRPKEAAATRAYSAAEAMFEMASRAAAHSYVLTLLIFTGRLDAIGNKRFYWKKAGGSWRSSKPCLSCSARWTGSPRVPTSVMAEYNTDANFEDLELYIGGEVQRNAVQGSLPRGRHDSHAE